MAAFTRFRYFIFCLAGFAGSAAIAPISALATSSTNSSPAGPGPFNPAMLKTWQHCESISSGLWGYLPTTRQRIEERKKDVPFTCHFEIYLPLEHFKRAIVVQWDQTFHASADSPDLHNKSLEARDLEQLLRENFHDLASQGIQLKLNNPPGSHPGIPSVSSLDEMKDALVPDVHYPPEEGMEDYPPSQPPANTPTGRAG